MKIIGIDLATKKGRTCLCSFDSDYRVYKLQENDKIIGHIEKYNPDIVTIDAPLSFPKNKRRAEEKGLHELGISAYPPGMPGMKKLTKRAISLQKQLHEFQVFEVYPYATKKLLDINISKSDINDAYLCVMTGKMYIKNYTVTLGESLLIPKPKKDCNVRL